MTVKIPLEGMDQEETKKIHCSFLTHERKKGTEVESKEKTEENVTLSPCLVD